MESLHRNIELPTTHKNKNENKKIAQGRKRNYCMFCKQLVTNYSRHIEKKHPDTDEGQKLLSVCDEDPKVRKNKKQVITDDLKKRANEKWNAECIQMVATHFADSGNKLLIPVKRRHASGNASVEDFSKCLHCRGFYRRNKLSVHLKKCKEFNKNRGTPLKSPLQ